MAELTPLRSLNDDAATAAFEEEILGPLLANGYLDRRGNNSWRLLWIMVELYKPNLPTEREALRRVVRGVRDRPVEHLEGAVRERLEKLEQRRAPDDLDPRTLGFVKGWLWRDARLLESVRQRFQDWRAPRGFQSSRRLKLQELVQSLVRSGELRSWREELIMLQPPVEVNAPGPGPNGSVDRVEGVDRVEAVPASNGADPVVKQVDFPVPAPTSPAMPPPPEPVQLSEEMIQKIQRRIDEILAERPTYTDRSLLDRKLAFANALVGEPPGVLVVGELPAQHELWFIGDMHGDLLGFEAALAYIEKHGSENRTTVFLGDVIDDGFHAYQLIVRLLREFDADPGRYLFLAGNHDEALVERSGGGEPRFASAVDPGDFASWVNQQLDDPERAPADPDGLIATVRLFRDFVARAPRALFLPKKLFAAHAGFPHRDLWDKLDSAERLADKDCLKDFVWNRWSDARKKIPNRGSSQSQFGAEDFVSFCGNAMVLLNRPIDAMVRGHDHVAETRARFARKGEVRKASYEHRILTINNMSFTLPREVSPFSVAGPRDPTLARFRPEKDKLPTPVVLELPNDLVQWYAPHCPECKLPNEKGAQLCAAQRKDGSPCATPLKVPAPA